MNKNTRTTLIVVGLVMLVGGIIMSVNMAGESTPIYSKELVPVDGD